MYSFSFNKEDKKRKNGNYEALSSSNDGFDIGVENGFANNGLSGFESQPGGASANGGNLSPNKVEASMSLAQNNVANGKVADSVPISARGLLGSKYKNDAAWSGRFFNYANPKASPERGAALYSTSSKALDDVVSDYYDNELSPRYNDNLSAARERSNKVFSDYSSNPLTAMRKVREAYDPVAIIDNTIQQVDASKLREMVEPLARRAGFDTDMYIEDYVKPALHDRLLTDYIDDNKPKNSAEYIFRSSLMNSLTGKGSNIAMGNGQYARLENESLSRYEPSRLEKFAAGVGSLLVDAPVFAGFGSLSGKLVGKTTSMFKNKLASRIFASRGADGISKYQAARISERFIMDKLKKGILQNATVQGLTLGSYDLSHSIADDVIYNESFDAGKAAGSFLRGSATGAASGAIGSRLNYAARGLTGGKRMLASTGVLSAESAVFTLSAEMDKLAHDVEIEPIDLVYDYGESLATLGVMKMTHWRPKGAENKLKADGTLRDELKLSESEKAEMREMNVDPVQFMEEVERGLNLPSYGSGATRDVVTERYLDMMQSKELSAATKSKLMYLIENKLTSTPPVPFDYSVEQNRNGEWVYTTYDFNGNKVEARVFKHLGKVKNHLLLEKGKLRNNRIAAYERELLQGIDSQNLLRQAGLYAQEKGVSVDDISQALYKRACNTPLTDWEGELVREIVERSSYNESGMVQYLADMRRNIEKRHGLEDGSLLVKVNEQFYRCTDAENRALDDYEALVRDEVNALKKGTDKTRTTEFNRMGEESRFKGMSNDEVKTRELEDYYTAHPKKNDNVGSGFNDKPIKIGNAESPGYVWSYNGVENTVEDIKAYEAYARDYARKFNYEVEFISDEREIPYPDVNDKYDVQNYNNKVRSMGWLDNSGKITINLPNIRSVEELERTIVHECVAHGGLLKLFGNHLNTFLEEVYRKSSGDVRAGIGNVKAKYPFADNFTVIEEYLAKLSEKAVVSPGERSWLTNVKDFIKNSLVRTNLYTGRNRRITEEDLNGLLRKHARFVEKRTEPSKYRQRVFGKFDAAKQNEETYYDRDAYEQDIRSKIAGGKFFIKTPSELYDTKLLQNYDLLPETKKQQALNRWGATDEQVRKARSGAKHRGWDDSPADVPLKNATLKDIFDDQSFYTKYPELAKLPVEVVDNMEMPVSYDAGNKKLVIDRSFLANPERMAYMPKVLQEVVRDFEGFNKAVSMNLFGIESRLGRKYEKAKRIIEAIDKAKLADPDFDRSGDIDMVFLREFGVLPEAFKENFPTLDEYTLYKLSGKRVPFNDDAVQPVVENRKRSGSIVSDLGDLMKYFNGPLDIVYEKLQKAYSDEPRKSRDVAEPENDFGYSEFKKAQDKKRRQLSDAVESRKWLDAFRHLDDELDVLN